MTRHKYNGAGFAPGKPQNIDLREPTTSLETNIVGLGDAAAKPRNWTVSAVTREIAGTAV